MRSESDGRLVRRCLNGDTIAFAQLVERHGESVFALVLGRLLRVEDAQDAAQETFLYAYANLARLRRPDSFGPWVRRIAYRRAGDVLRRGGRELTMDTTALLTTQADLVAKCEEFERRHDIEEILLPGLRTLPESLRLPLVMRYWGDASTGEIAETFAITSKAVERRIERAKKRLRRYFARAGKEAIAFDLLRSYGLMGALASELVRQVIGAAAQQPPPSSVAVSHGTSKVAYAAAGTIAAIGVFLLLYGGARISERLRSVPWEDENYGEAISGADASVVAQTQLGAPTPVVLVRNVVRGGMAEEEAGTGTGAMAAVKDPTGSTIVATFREGAAYDIFRIDPDGSDPVNLTSSPAWEWNPVLSPNGEWIAFVSNRAGNNDIYVMRSDGTDVRPLTRHPGEDLRPSWSPEGTQIAFYSSRDGPDRLEIYVIDADGSNLRRLTDGGVNRSPSWSPDGKKILFSSERTGTRQLYLMNPDGSAVEQLTHGEDWKEQPLWSPDGKRIAYVSDAQGPNEVYMMNADGTGSRRVAENPRGSRLNLMWSSDGKWLIVDYDPIGVDEVRIIDVEEKLP